VKKCESGSAAARTSGGGARFLLRVAVAETRELGAAVDRGNVAEDRSAAAAGELPTTRSGVPRVRRRAF